MKLKLGHKGLILVMVPLLVQMALLSWLFFLQQQTEREVELEAKGRKVVEHLNNLFAAVTHTVGDMTGYAVTGEKKFLDNQEHSQKTAKEQFEGLQSSLADDQRGLQTVHEMQQLLEQGFDDLRYVKDNVDRGYRTFALLKLMRAKPYLSRLEAKADVLIEEEQRLYTAHSQASRAARKATEDCILVGVGINLVLALGLVFFFSRGTTSRLNLLMDNTRRLAAHKPLEPIIGGVDEIAELDKVFHEMAGALEAAAQRKTEILHMVAHDLRSPLTSAQISLELLHDGVYGTLPAGATKVSASVNGDIDRLIKLINDFLDVERMQSGKLPLSREKVALVWVFERAAEILAQLARRKQISIEYPDQPGFVNADADRLVQVVTNLLSNAIKYSPEQAKVVIEVEPSDGWVTVSVTDCGPGLAADKQTAIFERFVQASAADQTKGSGLGLAICKAIIESHGGTIGVKSNANEGASFWFKLPLAGEPAPAT